MAPQYINASLKYRWLTIHLRKKESTIHFDISDFVLTNSCGQYLQKGIHEQILYREPYTYDVHEICPNFQFSFLPPTQNDEAEASLSTLSWLYILVCAIVQKYHEMFS